MRLADLTFKPRFAYGDQAIIAETSGEADDTVLGTGFVRLDHASVPWTLQYDEVLLVLEGTLVVRSGGKEFELRPTDSIWLPEGTALVYEAEHALVFYAIHPADWPKRTRFGEYGR